MGNVRADLEEFETVVGELIEAVAIGRRRSPHDFDHDAPVAAIGRAEALTMLDYEYGSAAGGLPRPHPVFAWTASWCLFLTAHDDAATLSWVPRAPGRCVSEHGGNFWLCGPHDWRSMARPGVRRNLRRRVLGDGDGSAA